MWIATQAVPPKGVAQNHNRRRLRTLFTRRQVSPQQRLRSKYPEERGGHKGAVNLLWLFDATPIHCGGVVGRHVFEDPILFADDIVIGPRPDLQLVCSRPVAD